MAPDFALHAWDDSWSAERATWLDNLFAHIDIAEYQHSAIVAHVYGDIAAITSKWYCRGKRGNSGSAELRTVTAALVRPMLCVRAAAALRMTAGAESRYPDDVVRRFQTVQANLIGMFALLDQVARERSDALAARLASS
jgi:hypothetical protein